MAGTSPAMTKGVGVLATNLLSRPSSPGILECMWRAFVYIMTNQPNGILYIGVTNDIARRTWEHREGLIDGFTKRYGLKRLVWFEPHQSIIAAIQREKTMKHWPRAWKVRLIHAENPDWTDLYETLR
jgi:putative endonuclease